MTELVLIDPTNYDPALFDINIASIEGRSFKDDKGQTVTYHNGVLTYDGRPPFFLKEGDTYGIQKAGNKKEEGHHANTSVQGMVQLPSTNPNAKKKRDKWQVAMKMTENAAPSDWTDKEQRLIDFVDKDLRNIIANILTNKLQMLQKVMPNVIIAGQEAFDKEKSENPTIGQLDQAGQFAKLKEHIKSQTLSKISKKIYRKKKKEEKEKGQFDLLNANSQFDETKHPMIYANLIHYPNKTTKKEEFITKFYQFKEGIPENEWPELSHAEAVAKGWQRMECAFRFDALYFGSTISTQLKAAECVLKKDISSGLGHKGRLIKARGDIKRNQRLVTRSAIQPAGVQNSNNAPVESTPTQTIDSLAMSQVFNPSALDNIPGLATPVVISGTGEQ